jgi:hypothetical protein
MILLLAVPTNDGFHRNSIWRIAPEQQLERPRKFSTIEGTPVSD